MVAKNLANLPLHDLINSMVEGIGETGPAPAEKRERSNDWVDFKYGAYDSGTLNLVADVLESTWRELKGPESAENAAWHLERSQFFATLARKILAAAESGVHDRAALRALALKGIVRH
jgi:hypothetical protein